MSNYDVVLKTVPPILVAARKITIPTNDQAPKYLDPAFEETYNHIQQSGAKKAGPHLTLWHQLPTVSMRNEVTETVVPIDRVIPGTERVNVYELPETQVASVVHHGDFADFTQGHTALLHRRSQ
ncbi:MAG: GyrI-like domain-containing protein [Anaerolineae bacterium]